MQQDLERSGANLLRQLFPRLKYHCCARRGDNKELREATAAHAAASVAFARKPIHTILAALSAAVQEQKRRKADPISAPRRVFFWFSSTAMRPWIAASR
jgi:hypothetical protein